jgi:hypothetical protein
MREMQKFVKSGKSGECCSVYFQLACTFVPLPHHRVLEAAAGDTRPRSEFARRALPSSASRYEAMSPSLTLENRRSA